MRELLQFYIDGRWVDPAVASTREVINPATEEVSGRISMGGQQDVERAVAAAERAAESYAATTAAQRSELLQTLLAVFERRIEEVAQAIMEEMGAPWTLARRAQATSGPQHIGAAIEVLKSFRFEDRHGSTCILREPIGPCALITPWNWPINQIAVKVAPALAAGCSMVLKPSELAPFSAGLFAEILHEAGVPAGVFNLVNGDGATVGTALSAHPGIAMVSFTGSTGAGVAVATNAAPTVKRVAQELGGKSANILLEDADFEQAVPRDVMQCFLNSGQSCNAPTRMLVPAGRITEVAELAKATAETVVVGDPAAPGTRLGPVVSAAQWDKIQALIHAGIDQGATLIAGGPGRPEGLARGYYVKPTVFSDVTPQMRIAQEEIFGPVLSIMGYRDEDEAVAIANDTPYGLSGYVSSADPRRARRIAARLRTGMVHINGAALDSMAPFGGYKQSGNGREWGAYGVEEFLELKSIYGRAEADV